MFFFHQIHKVMKTLELTKCTTLSGGHHVSASCKWAAAGWTLANIGMLAAPFTGGFSLTLTVASWVVATGGIITSC
jgi:hypothetical protein